MTSIPARELRNNTAAILRRVEAGEEFEVFRNDVPVARIIPLRGRVTWQPAVDIVWALERLGADLSGLGEVLRDATSDSTDELDVV